MGQNPRLPIGYRSSPRSKRCRWHLRITFKRHRSLLDQTSAKTTSSIRGAGRLQFPQHHCQGITRTGMRPGSLAETIPKSTKGDDSKAVEQPLGQNRIASNTRAFTSATTSNVSHTGRSTLIVRFSGCLYRWSLPPKRGKAATRLRAAS